MIGDVGLREIVGIGHQDACDVERDVAVADDDRALPGQVEGEVGEVGVAVVPGDEFGGRHRAGQLFAGDAEPLIGGRPDGIDDRVVAGGQFVVADVLADLDVKEVTEIALGRGCREGRLDALGCRVVGGDSRAHQPVWRRQTVEHVDRDLRFADQFLRGIERGRSGADDGDADVSFGQLGGLLWRDQTTFDVVVLVVIGVDLQVGLIALVELIVGNDRLDGAFVDTCPAVDAGVRVDVEALGGEEGGLVGRRVDTVDRAHRDAARIVTTGACDHMGHRRCPRSSTRRTCSSFVVTVS